MGQGNLEAVIKVLKDVGSGVVQLLSLSIVGSGGEPIRGFWGSTSAN